MDVCCNLPAGEGDALGDMDDVGVADAVGVALDVEVALSVGSSPPTRDASRATATTSSTKRGLPIVWPLDNKRVALGTLE